MTDYETIGPLIENIYDAALDPVRWQSCLEPITEAIGGANAILSLVDTEQRIPQVAVAHRLCDDDLLAYAQYYAYQDVWLEPMEAYPTGTAVTGDMLIGHEAFLGSEHFNDFLHPQNIFHVCGFSIMRGPTQFGLLSVFRPSGCDNFDAEEKATLQALAPHIQRAVQISMKLGQQADETTLLEDTLSALTHGVVIVDQQARILFANTAAQRVLDLGTSLRSIHGEVTAHRAGDTNALHRLIASAAATSLHGTGDAGGVLSLAHHEGGRPVEVLVAPLPASWRPGFYPGASAVLFIKDPDTNALLPETALRELYGLTPAEARLAAALASGINLNGYAERAEITIGTVRGTLKQIFQKTDTNSQPELIRLLLAGPLAHIR